MSFVVAAAASSGINYLRELPYRNTAAADTSTEAVNGPLRALVGPDEHVYYLNVSAITPDGRYCVRQPIIADGPDGKLVMAGVGREGSGVTTITLGEIRPGTDSEILKATLTWSAELGSFVTSELVEVGEVVPMRPGENCEV